MKSILSVLIIILSVTTIFCEEIPFITFDTKTKFYETRGEEFPGTVAEFFQINEDNTYLKIYYEFKDNGEYAAAMFPCSISSVTGISFSTKGTGDKYIIRLVDANDEIYMIKASQTSQLSDISFNLSDINTWGHYMGDQNNTFDLPIKRIDIGPARGEINKGDFFINQISLITDNYKKLSEEIFKYNIDQLSFSLNTNTPGNLFYFGDKPTATIKVSTPIPQETKINLKYKDVYGKEIKGKNTVTIKGNESEKFTLPKIKGWCEVEFSCTLNQQLKTGKFHYGFIPDNRALTHKNSPFGINTHFNQNWDEVYAQILNICGIKWIRDGNIKFGTKNNHGEIITEDRAQIIAQKYNLNYIPTFADPIIYPSIDYLKEEIAKGKGANDTWDFTPFIQFFGDYAEKYKDTTDIYDIHNEPYNYGWAVFKEDTWESGPWLKVFTQWSRQVSKLIKSKDPTAKILWEDVENFNYSDVFLENGNILDYISQHPYCLHRDKPKPEEEPSLNYYEKFWTRNKTNNLNWQLIAGEFGYSTFKMTDKTPGIFYSETSLKDQAAYIVRGSVLHLSKGTSKIFPYDLKDDNDEVDYLPENNFGLMFRNATPKPAICAYTNLINITEGSVIKDRKKTDDDNVFIFPFTDRLKKDAFICWTQIGTKKLSLDTKTKSVTLIDLYGNRTELKPKNGKIQVTLSENPIYIIF